MATAALAVGYRGNVSAETMRAVAGDGFRKIVAALEIGSTLDGRRASMNDGVIDLICIENDGFVVVRPTLAERQQQTDNCQHDQ